MHEEEPPERGVDATAAVPIVHQPDEAGMIVLGRMAPAQAERARREGLRLGRLDDSVSRAHVCGSRRGIAGGDDRRRLWRLRPTSRPPRQHLRPIHPCA